MLTRFVLKKDLNQFKFDNKWLAGSLEKGFSNPSTAGSPGDHAPSDRGSRAVRYIVLAAFKSVAF